MRIKKRKNLHLFLLCFKWSLTRQTEWAESEIDSSSSPVHIKLSAGVKGQQNREHLQMNVVFSRLCVTGIRNLSLSDDTAISRHDNRHKRTASPHQLLPWQHPQTTASASMQQTLDRFISSAHIMTLAEEQTLHVTWHTASLTSERAITSCKDPVFPDVLTMADVCFINMLNVFVY